MAPETQDLDLVTVFRCVGTSSEMETLSIHALLQAEGIEAVVVGDARYPVLPEEVRVARKDASRAKQLIQEALAVGPAGAEEAEAAGEESSPGPAT